MMNNCIQEEIPFLQRYELIVRIKRLLFIYFHQQRKKGHKKDDAQRTARHPSLVKRWPSAQFSELTTTWL